MDIIPVAKFLGINGNNWYKQIKRNQLIEALSNAQININDPELQNEDFIGCFLATESAIAKCTSKTKFNALVSMFVKGTKTKKIINEPDRYQEILSIISDLSFREIQVLYYLYQFDAEHKVSAGEKSDSVAKKQLTYIANQFATDLASVKAWIIRLKRTGLLISDSELGTDEKQINFNMGFELHHLSSLATELKGWVLFTFETEPNHSLITYSEDSL